MSDPPVPGALEFLDKARECFQLAIFSSRSHQPFGIVAMQTWLKLQYTKASWPEELMTEILDAISWPIEKPPALVTLDDRAVTFTGIWPDVAELRAFKPWNKRNGPRG